jgi:hypothetical protein
MPSCRSGGSMTTPGKLNSRRLTTISRCTLLVVRSQNRTQDHEWRQESYLRALSNCKIYLYSIGQSLHTRDKGQLPESQSSWRVKMRRHLTPLILYPISKSTFISLTGYHMDSGQFPEIEFKMASEGKSGRVLHPIPKSIVFLQSIKSHRKHINPHSPSSSTPPASPSTSSL